MTWTEAKEWAAWSFGGIGAYVGFRRFAFDRKAARDAAIDIRIDARVNPESLHKTLARLEQGQEAITEKLDDLQSAVSRLEGINEGAQRANR